MNSRRTIVLALAILVLAIGCDDDDGSVAGPETVSILSVAVDSSTGPLIREVTVELSAAANVEVLYSAVGTPTLRIASTSADSQHALLLGRLRPSDVYEYEVRVTGSEAEAGPPVTGIFSTERLPGDLGSLRFDASGQSTVPLVMLEARSDSFNGFVIVDEDGRVVWFWRTDGRPQGMTRLPNGNFVFVDQGRGLVEVTPEGQVQAELPQVEYERESPNVRLHHDVLATPQNTVLFLTRDIEQVINDTLWVGDAIWEWDPESGSETLRWDPFDFLSPTVDIDSTPPHDWLHSNSITYGPRGNVLISLRALDQVISIAPDFQSLEWRLGGPGSDFTFGTDAAFAGQHTATEVSPGRVLVFDNGLNTPEETPYSRALEVDISEETGMATKAWEFRAQPDNYAPFISAAWRLANGNTLVTFGPGEGLRGAIGPIEVFEVTPGSQVVWHLVPNGLNSMYRANPLDHLVGETEVVEE